MYEVLDLSLERFEPELLDMVDMFGDFTGRGTSSSTPSAILMIKEKKKSVGIHWDCFRFDN